MQKRIQSAQVFDMLAMVILPLRLAVSKKNSQRNITRHVCSKPMLLPRFRLRVVMIETSCPEGIYLLCMNEIE